MSINYGEAKMNKSVIDTAEGRNYSYELTQKLTFFIVTAELAFCGYILLNADKAIKLSYAPYLFLMAGAAALLGLLWRFAYNLTFHAHAHSESSSMSGYFDSFVYKAAMSTQHILHNLFGITSAAALLFSLISGFIYLTNFKDLTTSANEEFTTKSEVSSKQPINSNYIICNPASHSTKTLNSKTAPQK